MTGEVSSIDRNGTDSNGETWGVHAFVARKLRRPLRPFDKYTGPYIACKEGKLWLGEDEHGSGYACLWPGGIAPAFREPIVSPGYFMSQDQEAALFACRYVLSQARKAARKASL